ncbi:MAG: hypothetical protein K6343_04170 [Caldisericaceae bacterium]
MKNIKRVLLFTLIFLITFLPNIVILSYEPNEVLISQTFSSKTVLLNEFMKAKEELLINIYGWTDFDFIPTLINIAKKGVKIKVMLEEAPYLSETQNFDIRDMLRKYGIEVRWAKEDFFLTHAKYIVIDGAIAIVLTGNFTYSSFSKNREFGLITYNTENAQVLRNLFYADFERLHFQNTNPNVLVSPIDSRVKVENALKSAKKSVKIWEQSISDPEIVKLLQDLKKQGVDVKILMPVSYASSTKEYLGDSVLALPNPYIHAKAFIVDDSFAYIGSNNFTTPSFDNEREVALFTYDSEVINELKMIWDWDLSHSYSP